MQDIDLQAITTDRIHSSAFSRQGVEADILRLDKIHHLVSGNKWFKLRHYLEEAKQLNKKRVISFGGAWSNHIIAAAAACHLNGFESTGIIRGEKPAVLSPVLQEAETLGMQLLFIDRDSFRSQQLPADLDTAENYCIAAGGYGENGMRGAATILEYCKDKHNYSHICCAVGTGTMMAGLLKAASSSQRIVGISVLKNNRQLEEDVRKLSGDTNTNFSILHDHHCGGYAKYSPALLQFMNDWHKETRIPTDFVYTGKLCFALHDLAAKGFFPEGSRILLIHSGGLTGNSSLKKGTLIF